MDGSRDHNGLFPKTDEDWNFGLVMETLCSTSAIAKEEFECQRGHDDFTLLAVGENSYLDAQ